MQTTKPKKMTTLQIRLDSDLKDEAKEVFEDIGTNLTDGLIMYIRYVIANREMPFKPTAKSTLERLRALPTIKVSPEEEKEIKQALEEVSRGEVSPVFENVDEAMEWLNN